MNYSLAETQAKIATQRSLKEAAKVFKRFERRFEDCISSIGTSKLSRKHCFDVVSGIMHEYARGRLLEFDETKECQRTSKHLLRHWIYLKYDETHPFNHIEEQVFTFAELLLSSREPNKPSDHLLNIHVKRHELERIYLRVIQDGKQKGLESILEPLNAYVNGLLNNGEQCAQQIENGKFVLLSENHFVVVECRIDGYSLESLEQQYLLTTILPACMWSRRRQSILEPWRKLLVNLNYESHKHQLTPIIVVKPSQINNPSITKIEANELKLIFG